MQNYFKIDATNSQQHFKVDKKEKMLVLECAANIMFYSIIQFNFIINENSNNIESYNTY